VPTTTPVVRGTQANDRSRHKPTNTRNARNRGNDQTNGNLRPVNQNDRNANDNRRDNPNWGDNNRGDNRNWNGNNNRHNVDMRRWHRNFDAPRRFRAGTYNAPRDYHYRRWGYGQRLPRDYYARNYWLMDFVMFGLLAPPDGYVWVRYGPDALLIDVETGEIIQVQYNVFYS
jgi:Ni/Co efflux regulator RcnB